MHPMYQLPQEKGPALYQGDIIDREALIKEGALTRHQDYMASREDFSGFCIVTQYTDEESRIVRFVPRETSPHRYPASFPPGRKVGASRSDSFEAGP